jgi:DNA-binding transcriptional LysR family regulator
LVPTATAIELARESAKVLELVDGFFNRRLSFDPASTKATFNLVTVDYLEVLLLPRLVQAVAKQAPHVDLVFHQTIMHKQLPFAMENGDIDLSIGYISEPPLSLRTRRLFQEEFVFIARKDHPSAGKRMQPALFCDLPHLLVTQRTGGYYGEVIDRSLAARNMKRRIALVIPHFMAAPHVVSQSDMVTLVPKRIARLLREQFAFQEFEPPVHVPPYVVSMYWHDRSHRGAGHRWLRRTIDEVSKQIPV